MTRAGATRRLVPTAVASACVLLFAPIAALYIYLCYRHAFTGVISDSAVYALLADHFTMLAGSDRGLAAFLLAHYPFPPLYPMALGVLGGGSHNPELTYVASGLFLLAGIGTYAWWVKGESRSTGFAVALALTFALLPITILHLVVLLSEHLYVFLTLLALAAYGRAAQQHSWLLAAGLSAGLAAVTRSIGFTLVLPLCALILVRHRNRAGLLAALAAITPMLAWSAYTHVAGFGVDYLHILMAKTGGNPISDLAARAWTNLYVLWAYWVKSFDISLTLHARWTASALLVLAGIGFLESLKAGRLDALYLLLYLGVIVVWPYPDQDHRFLFPVFPLLLWHGAQGARSIGHHLGQARLEKLLPGSFIVIAAVLSIPSWHDMYWRFGEGSASDLADYARTPEWLLEPDPRKARETSLFMQRLYASMKTMRNRVPAQDCVWAVAPPYVMLHAGLRSLATPSPQVQDEDFYQRLRQCPYVFMMAVSSTPDNGLPPMYPFRRIRDHMQVLDVRYSDPGNPASAVASMLARVLP